MSDRNLTAKEESILKVGVDAIRDRQPAFIDNRKRNRRKGANRKRNRREGDRRGHSG